MRAQIIRSVRAGAGAAELAGLLRADERASEDLRLALLAMVAQDLDAKCREIDCSPEILADGIELLAG